MRHAQGSTPRRRRGDRSERRTGRGPERQALDSDAGCCSGFALSKLSPGEPQSLFVVPSAPSDAVISISAALAPAGLQTLVATVLQPVSERGPEAIEELESQVVKLLSFQPVSQVIYDAQVGFNMLSAYGPESRTSWPTPGQGLPMKSRSYLAGRAPMPATMLVQAPVFHSHAFTVYAEFKSAPALDDLVSRLQGAGLKVARAKDEPPTQCERGRRAAPRAEATGA